MLTNAVPRSCPTRACEAWFLTSELEGERASSFRQERWCRIFLDAGARVRIFNLQGAFGHSDTQCATHTDLSEFRRRATSRYKGPQASVREGFSVRCLRPIKHLLLIDLYLPNVIRVLLHVDRLLRQRADPVVLMASSPPFSTAIVGTLLKKLHRDKVVLAVDMRDAWALHNALGGIKPVKRAIERAVLTRADYVSTVSYGLADEFMRACGVEVGVMYNVATHYLDVPKAQPADWARVSPEIEPQRRHLVYTGSTPEGHYDVKSIVRSVVLLRQSHPELADCLQMVFVGACDEVRREATSQNVVPGDIVFIGHLPHAVVRSLQASADALLFLAHFGKNNAGVVSTKLFEYLCLSQPVLPLGLHKGSDVDQLLRRYCGKSLNAHTADEMMHFLVRLAREGNAWLPRLYDVQRLLELLDDYRTHARRLLA